MEQKNYGYYMTSTYPNGEELRFEYAEYEEALDSFISQCESRGRLCALVEGKFLIQLHKYNGNKLLKSLSLDASEFNH